MDAKLRLLQMLTYKRPHKSESEHDFIRRFILPYRPTADGFNNLIIVTNPKAKTLFSCHTDTVHRSGGIQQILYDEHTDHILKNDGEPLGADDGLGCWLMLEMIDAKVPGTYIFHRAEECGGQGSGWVKQHKKDWLKQFDRAIAFDRKDVCSVITFQRSRRCCSDAFADALCAALDADGTMQHEKDDGGVFTDTANYDTLIPECTNISAGYYDEHTQHEMQNVEYALALRAAAIKLDWEALPTRRDPAVYEGKQWGNWGDDDWGLYGGSHFGKGKKKGRKKPAPTIDQLTEYSEDQMKQFCWEYPNEAGKYLHALMQHVLGTVDSSRGDDAGPVSPVSHTGPTEDGFSQFPF